MMTELEDIDFDKPNYYGNKIYTRLPYRFLMALEKAIDSQTPKLDWIGCGNRIVARINKIDGIVSSVDYIINPDD